MDPVLVSGIVVGTLVFVSIILAVLCKIARKEKKTHIYREPRLFHKGKYIELATEEEVINGKRQDVCLPETKTGYMYDYREDRPIRQGYSTDIPVSDTSIFITEKQRRVCKLKPAQQATRGKSNKQTHDLYRQPFPQVENMGKSIHGMASTVGRVIKANVVTKKPGGTGGPHAECLGHNSSPVGKRGIAKTRVFHSPNGTFQSAPGNYKVKNTIRHAFHVPVRSEKTRTSADYRPEKPVPYGPPHQMINSERHSTTKSADLIYDEPVYTGPARLEKHAHLKLKSFPPFDKDREQPNTRKIFSKSKDDEPTNIMSRQPEPRFGRFSPKDIALQGHRKLSASKVFVPNANKEIIDSVAKRKDLETQNRVPCKTLRKNASLSAPVRRLYDISPSLSERSVKDIVEEVKRHAEIEKYKPSCKSDQKYLNEIRPEIQQMKNGVQFTKPRSVIKIFPERDQPCVVTPTQKTIRSDESNEIHSNQANDAVSTPTSSARWQNRKLLHPNKLEYALIKPDNSGYFLQELASQDSRTRVEDIETLDEATFSQVSSKAFFEKQLPLAPERQESSQSILSEFPSLPSFITCAEHDTSASAEPNITSHPLPPEYKDEDRNDNISKHMKLSHLGILQPNLAHFKDYYPTSECLTLPEDFKATPKSTVTTVSEAVKVQDDFVSLPFEKLVPSSATDCKSADSASPSLDHKYSEMQPLVDKKVPSNKTVISDSLDKTVRTPKSINKHKGASRTDTNQTKKDTEFEGGEEFTNSSKSPTPNKAYIRAHLAVTSNETRKPQNTEIEMFDARALHLPNMDHTMSPLAVTGHKTDMPLATNNGRKEQEHTAQNVSYSSKFPLPITILEAKDLQACNKGILHRGRSPLSTSSQKTNLSPVSDQAIFKTKTAVKKVLNDIKSSSPITRQTKEVTFSTDLVRKEPKFATKDVPDLGKLTLPVLKNKSVVTSNAKTARAIPETSEIAVRSHKRSTSPVSRQIRTFSPVDDQDGTEQDGKVPKYKKAASSITGDITKLTLVTDNEKVKAIETEVAIDPKVTKQEMLNSKRSSPTSCQTNMLLPVADHGRCEQITETELPEYQSTTLELPSDGKELSLSAYSNAIDPKHTATVVHYSRKSQSSITAHETGISLEKINRQTATTDDHKKRGSTSPTFCQKIGLQTENEQTRTKPQFTENEMPKYKRVTSPTSRHVKEVSFAIDTQLKDSKLTDIAQINSRKSPPPVPDRKRKFSPTMNATRSASPIRDNSISDYADNLLQTTTDGFPSHGQSQYAQPDENQRKVLYDTRKGDQRTSLSSNLSETSFSPQRTSTPLQSTVNIHDKEKSNQSAIRDALHQRRLRIGDSSATFDDEAYVSSDEDTSYSAKRHESSKTLLEVPTSADISKPSQDVQRTADDPDIEAFLKEMKAKRVSSPFLAELLLRDERKRQRVPVEEKRQNKTADVGNQTGNETNIPDETIKHNTVMPVRHREKVNLQVTKSTQLDIPRNEKGLSLITESKITKSAETKIARVDSRFTIKVPDDKSPASPMSSQNTHLSFLDDNCRPEQKCTKTEIPKTLLSSKANDAKALPLGTDNARIQPLYAASDILHPRKSLSPVKPHETVPQVTRLGNTEVTGTKDYNDSRSLPITSQETELPANRAEPKFTEKEYTISEVAEVQEKEVHSSTDNGQKQLHSTFTDKLYNRKSPPPISNTEGRLSQNLDHKRSPSPVYDTDISNYVDTMLECLPKALPVYSQSQILEPKGSLLNAPHVRTNESPRTLLNSNISEASCSLQKTSAPRHSFVDTHDIKSKTTCSTAFLLPINDHTQSPSARTGHKKEVNIATDDGRIKRAPTVNDVTSSQLRPSIMEHKTVVSSKTKEKIHYPQVSENDVPTQGGSPTETTSQTRNLVVITDHPRSEIHTAGTAIPNVKESSLPIIRQINEISFVRKEQQTDSIFVPKSDKSSSAVFGKQVVVSTEPNVAKVHPTSTIVKEVCSYNYSSLPFSSLNRPSLSISTNSSEQDVKTGTPAYKPSTVSTNTKLHDSQRIKSQHTVINVYHEQTMRAPVHEPHETVVAVTCNETTDLQLTGIETNSGRHPSSPVTCQVLPIATDEVIEKPTDVEKEYAKFTSSKRHEKEMAISCANRRKHQQPDAKDKPYARQSPPPVPIRKRKLSASLNRKRSASPVHENAISNFVDGLLENISVGFSVLNQSQLSEPKGSQQSTSNYQTKEESWTYPNSSMSELCVNQDETSSLIQMSVDIHDKGNSDQSVIRAVSGQRRLCTADPSAAMLIGDTVAYDPTKIPDRSKTLREVLTSAGISKKIENIHKIADVPDVELLLKEIKANRASSSSLAELLLRDELKRQHKEPDQEQKRIKTMGVGRPRGHNLNTPNETIGHEVVVSLTGFEKKEMQVTKTSPSALPKNEKKLSLDTDNKRMTTSDKKVATVATKATAIAVHNGKRSASPVSNKEIPLQPAYDYGKSEQYVKTDAMLSATVNDVKEVALRTGGDRIKPCSSVTDFLFAREPLPPLIGHETAPAGPRLENVKVTKIKDCGGGHLLLPITNQLLPSVEEKIKTELKDYVTLTSEITNHEKEEHSATANHRKQPQPSIIDELHDRKLSQPVTSPKRMLSPTSEHKKSPSPVHDNDISNYVEALLKSIPDGQPVCSRSQILEPKENQFVATYDQTNDGPGKFINSAVSKSSFSQQKSSLSVAGDINELSSAIDDAIKDTQYKAEDFSDSKKSTSSNIGNEIMLSEETKFARVDPSASRSEVRSHKCSPSPISGEIRPKTPSVDRGKSDQDTIAETPNFRTSPTTTSKNEKMPVNDHAISDYVDVLLETISEEFPIQRQASPADIINQNELPCPRDNQRIKSQHTATDFSSSMPMIPSSIGHETMATESTELKATRIESHSSGRSSVPVSSQKMFLTAGTDEIGKKPPEHFEKEYPKMSSATRHEKDVSLTADDKKIQQFTAKDKPYSRKLPPPVPFRKRRLSPTLDHKQTASMIHDNAISDYVDGLLENISDGLPAQSQSQCLVAKEDQHTTPYDRTANVISDKEAKDPAKIPDLSKTLNEVLTSSGISKKIKKIHRIADDPDVEALLKVKKAKRASTSCVGEPQLKDERKRQQTERVKEQTDINIKRAGRQTGNNTTNVPYEAACYSERHLHEQSIGTRKLSPRDILMQNIRSIRPPND